MDPEISFGLGPAIAGPLVLVCLAVSAFFSAGETAITGASLPRMHRLAQQGSRRARTVLHLLNRKDRVISTMLFGNTVVNILAASLTTAVLTDLFGSAGVVYATFAVTALVLVFAEVLPKTWALLNADRVVLALAPVIRLAILVLGPPAAAGSAVARAILRLFGVSTSTDEDPHAQGELLRGAIDMHGGGENADTGAPDEKKMLRSVLELADVTVASVMVHRAKVEAIDAAAPTSVIVEQALASPHTRLPLWRGQPENVVGVIHTKALFRAVAGHEGPLDSLRLDPHVGKPWFIPETTSLLDQLQAFKRRREHFALVVDEYGNLEGVVTLEDIIEEIVGEIEDETDLRIAGVEPQPDGSFICPGAIAVRDLNREFGWSLPEEVATTIAGIVLHEARLIPDVGQTFGFFGFRFEILGREGNRISRLRVTPPLAATTPPG